MNDLELTRFRLRQHAHLCVELTSKYGNCAVARFHGRKLRQHQEKLGAPVETDAQVKARLRREFIDGAFEQVS